MTNQLIKPYYVYMIRCADTTLYTGIALDPVKRVMEHNTGMGAKYIVPKKRPVTLVYVEGIFNQSEAKQREYAIKQFTKQQKLQLVESEVNQVKNWV
jgi:putative endonuclease